MYVPSLPDLIVEEHSVVRCHGALGVYGLYRIDFILSSKEDVPADPFLWMSEYFLEQVGLDCRTLVFNI